MTRRGYFEKQDDEYRLRIVKPGFDADDPDVSPNNVIIDSHSLGTLSVVKSGITQITSPASYAAGQWIVTGWDLPYIPLCTFLFGWTSTGEWYNHLPSVVSFGTVNSQFLVTRNGIYVKSGGNFVGAGFFPLEVHYTAYRLPV